MIRIAKLQLLGPTVVFVAVATSEVAAFALAKAPASEALWYLNLHFLSAFQASYYTVSSLIDVPYAQLFLIGLAPFAIAAGGLVLKNRFLLALGSHLSFVAAGFLAYCGLASHTPVMAASLVNIAIPVRASLYLPLALVGASLISFVISQYQYLLGFFRRSVHNPSTF
jgi:hypothetical protein